MDYNQMKIWIDNASYEQMLDKWRNSPLGDIFFMDGIGEYYAQKMKEKREQAGNEQHVQTSKSIGWK